MIKHFKVVFKSCSGDGNTVIECQRGKISEVQNSLLVKRVTNEEVKGSPFFIKPDKSGPDEHEPRFLSALLGVKLRNFVKTFSRQGNSQKGWNQTQIVLDSVNNPTLYALTVTIGDSGLSRTGPFDRANLGFCSDCCDIVALTCWSAGRWEQGARLFWFADLMALKVDGSKVPISGVSRSYGLEADESKVPDCFGLSTLWPLRPMGARCPSRE
nr:uncharacterized protein LOC109162266 [Ipomoea batatas]